MYNKPTPSICWGHHRISDDEVLPVGQGVDLLPSSSKQKIQEKTLSRQQFAGGDLDHYGGASAGSMMLPNKPVQFLPQPYPLQPEAQHVTVESCLNVNLLKERVELELSLKREGLRFFLTLVFGFLFAYTHLLAFSPAKQYETGWLVTEKLGLASNDKLASTREAYNVLMDTARAARIFYPLSSFYMENGLAKTLIEGRQKFLNGQKLLPLDSHPALPMEWSIYFRLRLEDWKNTMPKRLQLISEHTRSGGRDLTCWGLYAKGLYQYILVYGDHNLEGGAVELDFEFDRETARTDPLGLSLVALSVNATHATVMLEDAGEKGSLEGVKSAVILPGVVTRRLPAGTQPTDCQSGSYYIGDEGLELASMEFQPILLTESTFHDVQDVGQPLSQLVIGTARPPSMPSDEQNSYQTDAHRTTQDLVSSGVETLEGLVRLSGAISMEGADASHSMATVDDEQGLHYGSGLDQDGSELTTPHPSPLSNTTANVSTPLTAILGEGLVAELPNWTAELIMPTSLASNLTSAFSDLSARGQLNFTLEWWASADDLASPPPMVEETRESISFADAATGSPRLTVEYVHGGDLPVSGGWRVRFNHAPACLDSPPGADAALCMQSPAFWCQAADSSTHDGLWRHFALRFSSVGDLSSTLTDGDVTLAQQFDLFQDGTSLCGVSFPAQAGLVPHGVDASSHVHINFRDRGAKDENRTVTGDEDGYDTSLSLGVGAIYVKELHLHSHALSDSEVLAMASNPQLMECLPLHLMTDNPDYSSSFGQTCADLAEQHSPTGSSADLDGGCALFSAIRNCPVSCRDFNRPLCFDGTLPAPLPGQSPFGNVTKSFLYEPLAHRYEFPGYGDDAYWAAIAQRSKAQWTRENDQRKDWIKLFNMVENMRYGTVMTANDLEGRTSLDPIWRVPAPPGGQRCPGEELGLGVFSHICSSEQTHQGIMDDLVAQGRNGDDVNIAVNFESGAMAAGSSFSMFMWARRRAMDDIHIIGADDENNLCFDFNSSHAIMMRNGMLADGPVSDVEEALRTGFVPIELEQSKHLTDNTSSAKLEGEWTFFALSVDAETEEVIFGRNDRFAKRELQGLKAGAWGCNSLKFIISVGGDLSISPLRVRASPITASGMQQLHLATRPAFRRVVAPRHSRRDRLTPLERRRMSFTSPVVGVAPILLLQQREAAGEALASNVEDGTQECENVVASQISSQLIRSRELACSSVYECALNQAVLPSDCAEYEGRSAGETKDSAFFGHVPMEYKGRTVYPEFAWGLDNEILVRDGQVLYPSEDYVDHKTTSVRLLSCLYNYRTHVAALLEADYDLRGLEVVKTVSMKQVKLLTAAEYEIWEGLMIGTVLLVVIVLILAIPAAIEEGRSVWKALHRKRDAVVNRMTTTFGSSRLWSMSKFRVTNPMKYTADTTQPDILDVVFFSGILLLLATELGTKRETLDMVADAFGDLAEKEWGSSELTFPEEMDTFLTKVQRAESRMESENVVKIMGFVILLMVGVRLVVFMKVHPRVATITRTFETVSTELLNFCFSFGIIFVFMALTAHLRFGASMEAFSTFRKALLTQFMVLLTVDLPDFGTDVFMTIYVAGYVVLCALSLLNFFLAIVVNGYTKVSEDVLENKVVNSIGKDILLVFRDLWIWPSNRWLDKTETLNILARAFPRIFENGYAQADTYKEQLVSRGEFVDVFTNNSISVQAVQQQRSRQKSGVINRLVAWVSRGRKKISFTTTTTGACDSEEVARIAGEMFDHYMRQFNRTVLVASRMSVDVSGAGHRAMKAEALQNDFAMAGSQTSKAAPARSDLIGARSHMSDDGACSHTSLEILSQLQ